MIKFQEKEIELDMQAEELEDKIYFETAKLLAYDEVARMIKKCAQEAATSKGTNDKKSSSALQHGKRERTITKEFLLECERKLAKSYVCTALGRDDDSIAITKEIAKDIAFEVTNSIHPISMETAPYVVAALRTLANGIEKEMNPLDKEIASALQELMNRFQFVKEEVKIDL